MQSIIRCFQTFTLLLAVSLMVSCAGNGNGATARLDSAEALVQSSPDSALTVLRSIDTLTLTKRSLRARYSLLHAMALDKNWIDTTDVNIVMPAVDYYSSHGSADRRAKAYYYLGRVQENGGDFSSANVSFLKAMEYIGASTDEYFKSLVYQAISNTYSETYLHEEAFMYSELSFHSSSLIDDTLGMNASRYRMAQDLNNLKRFQEADSIYRILINGKGQAVSPQIYPAILSDYALLRLLSFGDEDYAVSLFEEALSRAGYLRSHNLWGAYAYALLRTGNSGRANEVFRQLEAADDDVSLSFKNWRALADAFLGDYESAYDRLSTVSEIQRMNMSQVLKQSTLKAQMIYQEQETLKERQRVMRRNILVIVICLLLLASCAGIIYYLRKRDRRIISERESMLESFHSLSDEYASINASQAAIRAKYIEMFKTLFGQTGQIQYLLRHSAKDQDTNLYRELKKAVGVIGTDEESQRQFEKILNDSLDDVMLHFREAFPGKKPRFYQLASFLFAGFDATTISNIILELSKENVYVEKSRLKSAIRDSDCERKQQFLELLS